MANEIATYLKYANLQMAAESLFNRLPTDQPGELKFDMNLASLKLAIPAPAALLLRPLPSSV